MNEIQDKLTKDASTPPQTNRRRHPITLDNPKAVMFARMANVKERIAAFEEKMDADRKKNSR